MTKDQEQYRKWLEGLKPGDEVAVWYHNGYCVPGAYHPGDETSDQFILRPNTPEDIAAETARRQRQQRQNALADRVRSAPLSEEQIREIEGVLDATA